MTAPLRILIAEDSTTDAKLVAQAIRAAGHAIDLVRVEDAATMRAALASQTWDLVISDWSMPTFNALGALAVVKEHGVDLPFIIVSGTVGEEVAVEAMRAGAHDYVLKHKLARLPVVIERELREAEIRRHHRESEKARRQSEQRFASLSESGIIGIVTATTSGEILDANDTFLGMVGYTRAELLAGQIPWQALTAPESRTATDRGLVELRELGVAAPYRKEYIRKDGSRIAVMIGIAMVEADRSIAFMVDLTAQQQAEAALAKASAQLRQAQKMEAVGRLAGGIAHDFNNLLSVIMSYGELLLEELAEDNPLRVDVGEICNASRRAADLTRQLLAFSRHEVVDLRVITIDVVLANMEKMITRILGEDVALNVRLESAGGRIRADPSNIEQVVLNLVVNSRDAMPTGGTLTIETRDVELDAAAAAELHDAKPGPYVLLAVTDTGLGMEASVQQQIFEPFFTTKGPGKGTGLGLSTVFGIVKQCGGHIAVESAPEKGAAFAIHLPRVSADAEGVVPERVVASLGGSETILLVEDEAPIRAVVNVILSKLGYRVIEANDALDALARSEHHPSEIDLLLTDVVMPQMSGPELAKRILRDRPTIKVLCMSGYTDDALVRHGAVQMGMGYLQKPITPTKLARKVRAILDAS